MDQVQKSSNNSGSNIDQMAMTERFKKPLIDLQRHWLTEYSKSREKLLCELTENLHNNYISDQNKIRAELLTQFKDELESTRKDLVKKFDEQMQQDLARLRERFKREISNAKKKQWCWQCESEAIYHCCWNTAYCSVECQQSHWASHRKFCRRNKKGGDGVGAPGRSGS
ncbi:hypothetical protein FO519_001011 [Halicephalobus sp. NKZ332]|nr:hypothetical protein FO519_001011 [Halicephalobus sp. NKZ332]